MKLTNSYQTKIKKNKGFTLMELIVVIALIAVLMLILVPTMRGFIEQAKLQSLSANAETIYRATTAVKLEWELEGKDPFGTSGEDSQKNNISFNEEVLKMAGISAVGSGQNCFWLNIYYDNTPDNNFLGMAYHDTKSNTTIYKQPNTNWTYDKIDFDSNSNSITITNLLLASSPSTD